MSTPRRVGRKPGPPASLTRDDVARAALAEGLLTLSMPTVARRLGVSHSTLYRYVHDRDDLVLAAIDLAVREFTWPAPDLGWRELLWAFADALWRFLKAHPGMAESIQVAPGLPARVTELATGYVLRLRTEGLGRREASIAVDLVADLTIATEIAMRGLDRTFETPRGRRSLRELYLESWQDLLVEAADATAMQDRGWLDDKLTLFFDGMATRVDPPTTAPGPTPDRDRVVTAARDLARREGLSAVTPRAVADLVGTQVTGVRSVVGDRDGLVVAMLDVVAEAIEVPAPDPDPRSELVALALAVHTALRADPWAVPALAVDGLAGPLILPLLDRVFTAFRAAGMADEHITTATRALWTHVFGAALITPTPHSFAARLVQSADSPVITAVTLAGTADGQAHVIGITALVTGLLADRG
ncbi:TetR/AcrR family transcriptional regulator [Actinokineospora cianjurensis]|uniref:TetR family transcriptional regulator n=1 Tax=Actinokineospora cianjurensis TaxID=585224 RepID=A0A421B3I0_9PSEU|nr:TetR family transcriptional regulator [Actinokineospora cianjurensis]RLK58986.1 TetR family transcriptional regulator [Actinokineospora cianjurensis]